MTVAARFRPGFRSTPTGVLGAFGGFLLSLLVPLGAGAQQPATPPTPAAPATLSIEIPGEPPDLVDRVVAVAGDSLILLSQLSNEMLVYAAQGADFPTEPDALRKAARDVLETMVNTQLLLQEAARDTTLALQPEETDSRVQSQIDAVQEQVGGAAQLQAAVEADGMTMSEYRAELRRRIEQDLTRQLYLQQQMQTLPPVAITEEEMRALYETQKAQLQQRPEILSIEEVVIPVNPPDSMWTKARETIDSLVARIRAGEDFAEVAAEASDDPGSGANGGDLGWFRRGAMVPEFDQVAFRLGDGQMSAPFRSSYGWHVIRVDRRRPGEVKARHILIRPQSGPDDVGDTMEKAREIARRMEAGESVDSLAAEYGHDDRVPTQLPRLSREAISTLPPGYTEGLAGATEGAVLPPFQIDMGAPFVAVVKVDDIREAGEFTFEDVEDQIRERLSQQKNLERIWGRLREQAYVDIRF